MHARCSRFTGGCPATFGGSSMSAFVMSTATGLRSLARTVSPSRCASRGIEPPLQNGSSTGGACSTRNYCTASGVVGAGSPLARATERANSAFAPSSTVWLVEFSHSTRSQMMSNSRSHSAPCASPVGNSSGTAEGSSTSWPNSTAQQAARGRRAHQRVRWRGGRDGCSFHGPRRN